MESLMEKENQLRKKAESGDYWDILHLAEFLYDQKRYEEAKEQFLNIVDLGIDDLGVVEEILLNRANSENYEIRKHAMRELLMIYLTGHYRVGKWGCETVGDNWDENKDVEKVIEASIVFAEYPELIDEECVDNMGYFETVLYFIDKDYEDEFDEYAERIFRTILNHAEKVGTFEEVLDKTEDRLSYYYADFKSDYEVLDIPFCLGYIPNGISYVPRIAFSSARFCNEELESIVIPDTIKKIKSCAFDRCVALNSVKIPSSVSEIGSFAFSDCSSLESIVIPKSVVRMYDYVFDGCDSLATIYCEAEEKPEGWDDNWLGDECDAEVIWGYKK